MRKKLKDLLTILSESQKAIISLMLEIFKYSATTIIYMRILIPALFLALLAIFLPSTFAQTATVISATIDPTEAIIKQNETATFLLTLSHDSAQTEFFELYSPDV